MAPDRYTCSLTKALLGSATVVIIAGTFNPFLAGDYAAAHGGEMPDWWLVAARVLPIVAALLFCYGVLDRHKAQFLPKR